MSENTNPRIVIEGTPTTLAFADSTQAVATSTQRNLIEGTEFPDILFGTTGNDEIRAKGGDDTIIGTVGDDLVDGADGFDTVDYSNLGQPIRALAAGVIDQGGASGGELNKIESIIGAVGRANTIDGSTGLPNVSLDIDLSANRATVNGIPGVGSQSFVVQNFVNVVGTNSSDSIVGNNSDNVLEGLGGNDTLSGLFGNDRLTGGDGNDLLIGSSSPSPGFSQSEQDVLTGSGALTRYLYI